MRALVTGGAGFIGSHLTDTLLARGDAVTVVDSLATGSRENLAAAIDRGADLQVEDITDAEAMARVVERSRPDVVFHLAAQAHVTRSTAEPVYDLRVNVEGTINLLELVRGLDRCRFVFTSTGGAIYGEGEGRELPLSEDAELEPFSQYGQSKMAAELYLDLYRRLYGISAIALRLPNVYGPRQDPYGEAGVIAIFSQRLHAGETPIVFGTGEQTRDFIFVGDVVGALIAASEANAGDVLNVGTGRETSVLELGARLGRLCGGGFEPRLEPERPGEVQRSAIANYRAAAILGWKPEVELENGLRQTADSFAPQAEAAR